MFALFFSDEDMQSMASLMSDVAAITDFDDDDDSINNGMKLFRFTPMLIVYSSYFFIVLICSIDSSMHQSLHEVLNLTAQMDKLTQSLSGSEFASTPMSSKCTFFSL